MTRNERLTKSYYVVGSRTVYDHSEVDPNKLLIAVNRHLLTQEWRKIAQMDREIKE